MRHTFSSPPSNRCIHEDFMTYRPSLAVLFALASALAPGLTHACASCGCTLSSDWESQGLSAQEGLRLDIRYDYLDQDQLRSGSQSISPSAASALVTKSGPQEVERDTKNDYLTTSVDYSFSKDWSVSVQIPYIFRDHSTLGTNSNGTDPADDAYTSKTSNVGDVKLIARYQGFTTQHNAGVLFGFKLPTGSHTQTGTSTDPAAPGDVATIDRGLQPGTGTTDAIIGAYYFDALNKNWDYFAQATYQTALDSSDDYRPGNGINLNGGLRFMGFTQAFPQLQLNYRHVEHDRGANADELSTGGDLLYLSPGVVVPLDKQTSVYSFLQLPLYQDVRGVQLAPRYTASIGLRLSF
jgi:hypothetical protein